METLGSGRATDTPEENARKLKEVFEIVRRNIEKASQELDERNTIQTTTTPADVVVGSIVISAQLRRARLEKES